MRIESRRIMLAAAIAMPLAAAAATIGLAEDAPQPDVPAEVRIGESVDSSEATETSRGATPPTTSTTKKRPPPTRTTQRPKPQVEVVPPAPPIFDDDNDDNDDNGADSPDDDDD